LTDDARWDADLTEVPLEANEFYTSSMVARTLVPRIGVEQTSSKEQTLQEYDPGEVLENKVPEGYERREQSTIMSTTAVLCCS